MPDMKSILFFICLLITFKSFSQHILPDNFEKSTIKIDKVEYYIYKGTIPVRTDHSDSSSPIINLPVHIIKSLSENPAEPIYWMEGGPGMSNLWRVPPKAFLDNHDFVRIGYRGADGIVLKKSKKLIKAIRGIDHQLLSDKSLDNIGKTMEEYASELAQEGIDINNFTVLDVVDDFEDVRKFLGHKKINICSESYGTRIALLYSYRYPETVHRSLMIGVNPPGCFVWYPENTRKIIRMYDSINVAQSEKVDYSIEECIKRSFENMPKRWSLFRLDADKIKATSFFMLYSKQSAVMAFDAYRRAAEKGDYSGLYMIQQAYDMVPQPNYGDFFCKGASADFDTNINYREVFNIDGNEIGSFTLLAWGAADKWPIKTIDPEYRKPRLCNTETLMVGGNLDISTPPQTATKMLLPYMPNAKQVILEHMAHCGDLVWRQYDAFTYMSLRYFDEGVVDTSQFKHDPIDFTPKKSFNKMAKWYYPAVLVMSIIK